jgi:hypothetical protein
MLVPLETFLLLVPNNLLLASFLSPLRGAVRMMEGFPLVVFSSLTPSNILLVRNK